jgi:hypothetical protein
MKARDVKVAIAHENENPMTLGRQDLIYYQTHLLEIRVLYFCKKKTYFYLDSTRSPRGIYSARHPETLASFIPLPSRAYPRMAVPHRASLSLVPHRASSTLAPRQAAP